MEKEVYKVAIFVSKMWTVLLKKKKKEKALEEIDSSPSQINGKKGGIYAGFHIWNKSILENWFSFYKFRRLILQELGIEPRISYTLYDLMCCSKKSFCLWAD